MVLKEKDGDMGDAAGIVAGRHLEKGRSRSQGFPESRVICGLDIPRGYSTEREVLTYTWGIKAWESDEGQDVIHILENEYIPEHPVMELGEIIRLPL